MSNRSLKTYTIGDKVLVALMLLLCFITLYPVWYTIVISFNDSTDSLRGGIYWFPRKFTLQSYITVFQDKTIIKAFRVTILRTLIGTVTNVLFTSMVAFALSKNHIIGRKFYMILGTITMFFGGGLIPYFILIKNIGLYDSFWVYVIPSLFNFYNMIIFMAFFRELPAGLEESAKLDGANEIVIFIRIILPLSLRCLQRLLYLLEFIIGMITLWALCTQTSRISSLYKLFYTEL